VIPIVSIVGRSGTGKTTLIERLLPILKQRGLKVATVKHYAHGFEMDYEGKDTWRHKQAGADAVMLSGSGKIGLVADVETDLNLYDAVARFIPACDLILSEGYKAGPAPKVEVVRREAGTELICIDPRDNLAAVATDIEDLDAGVPLFGLDDPGALADFLQAEFVKPSNNEARVELEVNGSRIGLGPFAEGMVSSTVRGLVNSLRGCGQSKSISLKIEFPEEE